MSVRSWLQLAGALVVVAVATNVYFGWRSVQRDQAALQEELKSAKQALAESKKRQDSRDEQLADVLKELARKKTAVQTPTQVVQALPEVLPLPTPLTLEHNTQGSSPGGPKPGVDVPAPKVALPAEDLKPLYDFAIECKGCKAELATANADLKDEMLKTAALTKERDDAVKKAKGGSAWQRVRRAAKWFLIGAVAGAAAAKLAH
jgi:hypothetical protein